jgi:RNA polymerase sigma-70 factor (ECF subfamily)
MYAGDLKRIIAGDEASLRRIIEEFAPLVRCIAYRVTGSEADADDIAQEVFIGLPEALRSFSGGNFPGWLKVVTRHRAQMMVRSEQRWQKSVAHADDSGVDPPDDHVLNRIMIEEALVRIDARQREVFLLKCRRGWSHSEIAESMGITESHSQVLLHRARAALRELLS